MEVKDKKSDRMQFRVAADIKELIEEAAVIAGFSSTSEYISSSMAELARSLIAEHQRLQLGDQERQAFHEALVNPPPATAWAKAAAAEYLRKTAKS